MVPVLFTIGRAVITFAAFCGINLFFRKLINQGKKERKRHDLAQTSEDQR